ncbi:hypothetical protein SAMN05216308_10228 [Nitrosospira sp. Nsp13]|nr:hypothetical protein SAMN05216308_10228 [Nitrosospira sp. Nsp13]
MENGVGVANIVGMMDARIRLLWIHVDNFGHCLWGKKHAQGRQSLSITFPLLRLKVSPS